VPRRIKTCRGKNNPNVKIYKIRDPNGKLHVVDSGLYEFCDKHGLCRSSVEKSYRLGTKMQNKWYIEPRVGVDSWTKHIYRSKARLNNRSNLKLKKYKEEMQQLRSEGSLLAPDWQEKIDRLENIKKEIKCQNVKAILGERDRFNKLNALERFNMLRKLQR
jgi:hypothetical protein